MQKKRNTVEVHLPGLCAHMFGCYESALLDKFLITTLSLAHNRYLFSHGAGGQNPKINVTGPKSKSYQGHTPSRGYSRKTFLASSSFWWLRSSLASGHVAAPSASVSTWLSFLRVSTFPSHSKDIGPWTGPSIASKTSS